MKKIKLIGLGKLLQVVHLPHLKKFYCITSCCDPRNKLLKSFKEKHQIDFSTKNVNIFFKKNKDSNIFICSSRGSSYSILKKAVVTNKIIFCEKPAIFNVKDAKELASKIKFKNQIKFGYMTRYDQSVVFLKKYLKKKKLNSKIDRIEFTLANNSFYQNSNKFDYIRTHEKNDFKFSKINYPKFVKSNKKIMYHVFLNRYSHVINMANFFFKKIQPISFNYKNIFNYNLKARCKNISIILNCNNKKKYLFKIHLYLKNRNQIICRMRNPINFYSSKIIFIGSSKKNIIKFDKKNIFKDEIRNIPVKKDFSSTDLYGVIEDLSLVQNFWKLVN